MTISNAIVDAFEAELFQSSAESAGRVVKNLNNRLDELRRNVTEAEQKVEDFRRGKGLQLNNGEPVSARLSSELNTQVLEAQQRFIQSESRYKQDERRGRRAAGRQRVGFRYPDHGQPAGAIQYAAAADRPRSGRPLEHGIRRWSRPSRSSRRWRRP